MDEFLTPYSHSLSFSKLTYWIVDNTSSKYLDNEIHNEFGPPAWSSLYFFLLGFVTTWGTNAVFTVLYYTLFEYFLQKTPAKFITKTIVLDNDLKKISFFKSVIRSLSRCIPFEFVSFLFLNGKWHDKFSKTIVVYHHKNR